MKKIGLLVLMMILTAGLVWAETVTWKTTQMSNTDGALAWSINGTTPDTTSSILVADYENLILSSIFTRGNSEDSTGNCIIVLCESVDNTNFMRLDSLTQDLTGTAAVFEVHKLTRSHPGKYIKLIVYLTEAADSGSWAGYLHQTNP